MNKPKKIVIVEDDINIAQLLNLFLLQNGYEIVGIAESGENAIAMAEELSPDLVIMDILLKGPISGIDAAYKIHNNWQIPIVFVTAIEDKKLFKRAKITEPYGYIIKPFNERELIIAVEIALQRKALEDKIKNTERFAQNTIDSSMDMIIAVDNRRKITEFNHTAEETFGYKKSEVIGKHINLLYSDPKKGLEVHKRTIKIGRHVQEIENKRKNGEVFPSALAASVLYDSRGVKIGVMGISRDISEQKKIKKRLMEAETRYWETLDNMLEGCQIIGYDWKYLYLNNSAIKQGRKTKKYLMGKTMMAAYPGIETTAMFGHLKRCMEERIPYIMENEFEYPHGEKGWFQISIQPIHEGVVILSLDITARKRAEIESTYYIKRLNAVNAASQVLTQSLELQTVLNNCTKVGMDTFEADDVTIFILQDEYLIPAATTSEYFKEIMAMRLKVGEGLSGKVILTGKAKIINRIDLTDVGAQIPNTPTEPESLMCAPLIVKNKPIGILTLSKIGTKEFQESDLEFIKYLADIGAVAIHNARLYESSKQSENLKALILANISHEVRTPLNAIMGFTELIEMSTRHLVREEEKKFFDNIQISSNRLIRTVEEILTVSDMESGAVKPKMKQTDLCKLVPDVLPEFQSMATEKGLTLDYRCDHDPAWVIVDPFSITLAIRHILDNAVKYTPQGGVNVSLHQVSGKYMLSIKDTGTGISEEYQKVMYKPFTQESEGHTKKFQGIGLGLTIVKRMLDLNKVALTVDSTKGKGTTVTLAFDPVDLPDTVSE